MWGWQSTAQSGVVGSLSMKMFKTQDADIGAMMISDFFQLQQSHDYMDYMFIYAIYYITFKTFWKLIQHCTIILDFNDLCVASSGQQSPHKLLMVFDKFCFKLEVNSLYESLEKSIPKKKLFTITKYSLRMSKMFKSLHKDYHAVSFSCTSLNIHEFLKITYCFPEFNPQVLFWFNYIPYN